MAFLPKPLFLFYFVATIVVIVLTSPVIAQKSIPQSANSGQYFYADIDNYTAFLNKIAKDNEAGFDKKFQKDYIKIITDKNTGLVKELNEKKFLFDGTVHPYLNKVFVHVLQKNGLNESQFHFFVNRTSSVNAYSYEEGTIVCNLGLLNIMDNESQLAMVLCHELGHYLLKHVNNSIITQLETYNSPEFSARVKKIKKQEYNSKRQLEELYKTDVFDRLKHNRLQEKAADSLGVVLFRNTEYNGTNVAHVFDLLSAAESSATAGILQGFFKQEDIRVSDNLLRPSKKMGFATIKKEEADSLKTHPDCAVRKLIMQADFNKKTKPGVDYVITDQQKFAAIQRAALFEEAAFSKENDNLSYYFYQLIQTDKMYPADRYIMSEIFDTLLAFCIHQKKHSLYTVVSNQYIPDDDKDEYALLLKLIDEMDLGELITITNKYYSNHKSQITPSPEAISNLKQLNN